jgi:hypothetical protein
VVEYQRTIRTHEEDGCWISEIEFHDKNNKNIEYDTYYNGIMTNNSGFQIYYWDNLTWGRYCLNDGIKTSEYYNNVWLGNQSGNIGSGAYIFPVEFLLGLKKESEESQPIKNIHLWGGLYWSETAQSGYPKKIEFYKYTLNSRPMLIADNDVSTRTNEFQLLGTMYNDRITTESTPIILNI